MTLSSPMTWFKKSNTKTKALSASIFIFATLILMEVSFGLINMLTLGQGNLDIAVAVFILIFIPIFLIIAVEVIWRIFTPMVEITYKAAKSEETRSIALEISHTSKDGVNSIMDMLKSDIGSIQGEMGRVKFLSYNLLGLLLILPILQGIYLVPYYSLFDLIILVPLVSLTLYIVYKLFIIPCSKRTVSLGLNPWLALALLVPAINIPVYIFMVFAPQGAARKISP